MGAKRPLRLERRARLEFLVLYNYCHHYADLYFVKGVPPNSQNLEKRTALHLSVINRNIETVRALLKVGASVNIQVRL